MTLRATLRTVATLGIHTLGNALLDLAREVKPTGLCVPKDATIHVVTKAWFYMPERLILEGEEDPIPAFMSHAVTFRGITVITSLSSPYGGDWSHVYVLFHSKNDPGLLQGRDEEGFLYDNYVPNPPSPRA